MTDGSIVVMSKPMADEAYKAMALYFKKPPPKPSSEQYMVTSLADEETCRAMHLDEGGIYLDEYPEYEKEGVPFDIRLFNELLPPSVNVIAMVEHEVKPAEIKQLV